MPRSVKVDPPVFFGLPGQYVEVPWPKSGMTAGPDRQTFDFVTGSGSHRVSNLIGTSRAYSLNWIALHQSTFDLLNQFAVGQNGPGPYVLIDPSRPNLLTGNQSAACSLWYAGNDFKPSFGSVAANRVTTYIKRQFAPRSAAWTPAVTGSGTATLDFPTLYSGWAGIPIVPEKHYCWQFWGINDAANTGVHYWAQVKWLSSTGAVLRTDVGTTFTGAAWNYATLGGPITPMLAPANAAYALPELACNIADLTSTSVLYLDVPVFEQADHFNDWAPGTGVLPVQILGLNEDMSFDALFRVSPTLTLREIK